MADVHLLVVLHQIDSLNVSNFHKNYIILKQCIHLKKWSMEIASDTANINCDLFEADTCLVGSKLQCAMHNAHQQDFGPMHYLLCYKYTNSDVDASLYTLH